MLGRAFVDFPANLTFLRGAVGDGAGMAATTAERFEKRRLLTLACRRHAGCPQLWLTFARFELRIWPRGRGSLTPPPRASGTRTWLPSSSSAATGDAAREAASMASEASGAEQRGRGVLELAVRSTACGGCAAVWAEYLHLEVRAGRPLAAGRVLLRALQQCPGVKRLWCASLRVPLVQLLPAHQLVDTAQLMVDKEVRLRHEPLEGLAPLAPSVLEAAALEAAMTNALPPEGAQPPEGGSRRRRRRRSPSRSGRSSSRSSSSSSSSSQKSRSRSGSPQSSSSSGSSRAATF